MSIKTWYIQCMQTDTTLRGSDSVPQQVRRHVGRHAEWHPHPLQPLPPDWPCPLCGSYRHPATCPRPVKDVKWGHHMAIGNEKFQNNLHWNKKTKTGEKVFWETLRPPGLISLKSERISFLGLKKPGRRNVSQTFSCCFCLDVSKQYYSLTSDQLWIHHFTLSQSF